MQWRNPIFTAGGLIDCEVKHPRYGWIPFTCDPADTAADFNTASLFAAMEPQAAPFVPPLKPTPAQDQQKAKRRAAFRAEADPLFFKWQAGEGAEAAWRQKREEIRARYPCPEPS